MKVEIISHTPNPKEVIYAAARQCYSSEYAGDIYAKGNSFNKEKITKFIKHLIKKGHLSPLEHVNFTFAIEGISRVCSHQLVRHRLASYSQQSQRYVSMENFKYIIPKTVAGNLKAKEEFNKIIDYLRESYLKLKDILEEEGKFTKEEINQDLRFILPQAVETKIVVTMNVRELLHFFSERLCLRAQWEIRALAGKMFYLCERALPEVFASAGVKCKVLKYCPEDDRKCSLFGKWGGKTKTGEIKFSSVK